MSDTSHRGASASPFAQSPDRRVLELDTSLREIEAVSSAFPALGMFRDSARARNLAQGNLARPGRFTTGVVVHAIPHLGWYRVKVADAQGTMPACMLAGGTLAPTGPKPLMMAGNGDLVFLYLSSTAPYAVIVGVIPPLTYDTGRTCPDWIVQCGRSGIKRDGAHLFAAYNADKFGGVVDWSAGRPQDQTGAEAGWITSLGLALTIDEAMIQMRVGEHAGLWMTLLDNWVRLSAGQLLVESSIHEEESGDDEGEARLFRGVAAYPWEALGLPSPGTSFVGEIPDKDAQYDGTRGKVDLPAGQEAAEPFYRYREYGGYLGQGSMRSVTVPDGSGVWREAVSLTGATSTLSTKGMVIGKRASLPSPRQIAPQQSAAGDDAAADNYRFSGQFGNGRPHKVGDLLLAPSEAPESVRRTAAGADGVAHATTWLTDHPFRYHEQDYLLPAPGADGGRQEAIDYNTGFYTPDPVPRRVLVDHRIGEAVYYDREGLLVFRDDGGVHVCAGAGEEFVLAGGRVRINAPKGIDLCSGGDFTVTASQIVMRARGSVDVSSSDRDVRIKAERNVQVLAGNGGKGGLLLESKGEGGTHDYADRVGEDVVGSGIVLKSLDGGVSLLGGFVYVRSLADTITLDAGQGSHSVNVVAKDLATFTTSPVEFHFGPNRDVVDVKRTYSFGQSAMVADVRASIGGELVVYNGGGGSGNVVVDGTIYATKAIASADTVSDKRGKELGKVPTGFAGELTTVATAAQTTAAEQRAAAGVRYGEAVSGTLYGPAMTGNDATIGSMGFSFRDPQGVSVQYKTAGFYWPESRWQQNIRLGLGTGGNGWAEKPVSYQGVDTYPWPGRAALLDTQTLLRCTPAMYDSAKGTDKVQTDPAYETSKTGEFVLATLDGNLLLNDGE